MRSLESETDNHPKKARSLAAELGVPIEAKVMIALFDVADLSAKEAHALVATLAAETIRNQVLP